MLKPFRIKKKSENEVWTGPSEDFEICRLNCGGLDVHSNLVVATIGITDAATLGTHYIQRAFGTFKNDMDELCGWLSSHGCADVAMESTGKYMVPVCDALEEHGIAYIVSHPKYCRSPENHKDDWADSLHICKMHKFNLVRASFIPPTLIRECRDPGRRYVKLNEEVTAEKNRFSNCMTSCCITLSQALSDPFGKTGRQIMKEILSSGKVDPERLAALVDPKCRNKDKVLESVAGAVLKPGQCFKMKDILSHIEELEKHRDATLAEISGRLSASEGTWSRIRTIPGIGENAALLIISETGYDMGVWKSARQMCFWAGLTPGSNSSNGKKKSTRITKGGHYLKPLLVQCALAAIKSKKNPCFGIKYQRLKKRKGHKKAIIAIARMLLASIYAVISTGEDFHPIDYEKVVDGVKKARKPEKAQAQEKSFTVQELAEVLRTLNNGNPGSASAADLLFAMAELAASPEAVANPA